VATSIRQRLDHLIQVFDLDLNTIPATRSRQPLVCCLPCTTGSRLMKQELETVPRQPCKSRCWMNIKLEAEQSCVKRNRCLNIAHNITHTDFIHI